MLLHSRYNAALLADSSKICSVAVRLADRKMARFASVYAPVSQRGTQQDFFCSLSHWLDMPGMWFAGGDFNVDLSAGLPVDGYFAVPSGGTWRRSVKHDWCSPIDGFVGPLHCRPLGPVEVYRDSVITQHAPIVCSVETRLQEGVCLSWSLPNPVSRPWTQWSALSTKVSNLAMLIWPGALGCLVLLEWNLMLIRTSLLVVQFLAADRKSGTRSSGSWLIFGVFAIRLISVAGMIASIAFVKKGRLS